LINLLNNNTNNSRIIDYCAVVAIKNTDYLEATAQKKTLGVDDRSVLLSFTCSYATVPTVFIM